jgi:uncharacterized membrane protein
MVQPVPTSQPMSGTVPGRRTAPALLVGALIAGAAIVLGTMGLWLHYGTAVFFEMIAAGFNACF